MPNFSDLAREVRDNIYERALEITQAASLPVPLPIHNKTERLGKGCSAFIHPPAQPALPWLFLNKQIHNEMKQVMTRIESRESIKYHLVAFVNVEISESPFGQPSFETLILSHWQDILHVSRNIEALHIEVKFDKITAESITRDEAIQKSLTRVNRDIICLVDHVLSWRREDGEGYPCGPFHVEKVAINIDVEEFQNPKDPMQGGDSLFINGPGMKRYVSRSFPAIRDAVKSIVWTYNNRGKVQKRYELGFCLS